MKLLAVVIEKLNDKLSIACCSQWAKVTMFMGSVSGSLFFLIDMNQPLDGLNSICKIFEYDTSIFTLTKDVTAFNFRINDGLWKMNP